jgi:hypothetical protein
MSTDEKITAFAFAVTVGLWIFGGAVGVNAVAAALTGLSILLVTGGWVGGWEGMERDSAGWGASLFVPFLACLVHAPA